MSALIKEQSILEFPIRKITANDYHVPIGKGLPGAIHVFTDKHLELHKQSSLSIILISMNMV